jgi:toxin ParE1/3/4
MSDYNVGLTADAEDDIKKAAKWYTKRSVQTGARFIAAIKESFADIARYPESYLFIQSKKPIRRYLLRKFPYKVYFTLFKHEIVILAVIHERRSKRYVRRRLGN